MYRKRTDIALAQVKANTLPFLQSEGNPKIALASFAQWTERWPVD